MRVVIFSDSHGSVSEMLDVLKNKPVDLVIHLGDNDKDIQTVASQTDLPFISVSGNCDFFPLASSQLITEISGVKMLLCHGNEYGGEESEVAEAAKQNCCELAMFGHTHVPVDTVMNGIRVINPGSIHKPRHPSPCKTYAYGEITGGKVSINIMEYGL